MTDVALRQHTDLIAFAEEASQVHGIAKALATTSFVPAAMKGKPDEITGAILFGRELGMDPMIALQTINVIQGRPTLTANAMRGLAVAAGVRFRLDEATETRCRMSALAPGEDAWTSVTWTIDQARKLGLTSKENWKNQPGAMLIARATSQLCRLVAANILIGCPYSTEEVRDLPAAELETYGVAPEPEKSPEKKTRVVRRQAPVKASVDLPEPELVPEPDAEYWAEKNAQPPKEIGYSPVDDEKRTMPEDPVERPDGITANTRKALMAGFNDINVRERTTRLAYVSDVVGWEVHSVNQLSEPEGRKVVNTLRSDPRSTWPQPAEVPS